MTPKPLMVALTMALSLTACQKPAEPTTQATTQESAHTTAIKDEQSGELVKDEQAITQTAHTDLSAETDEYKQWVEGQIDNLLTDTKKFALLLKEGKLDEAKAMYPLVRMYFERSEPIAESFDDLDPRIDNREADLEQGETWTGFHAIEKILWTQNTTKGTEELADQLVFDVRQLQAKIPTAEVTPELMIEGAVDLLNEISTTKITGEEEIFSKTDLYDFKANIEGAQKIFEILKPKLSAKDPKLVQTLEERFSSVHALLDKYKVGDKHYQPYTDLTDENTKELAEAVNKLGEPLGQMGIVMQ